MIYGERFRQILKDKRLKQEEVAYRAGTRQQNINNWLKSPKLTVEQFEILCKALDINPRDFWAPKEDRDKIPENLIDFFNYFKNKKPELQTAIIELTYKLGEIIDSPSSSEVL